MRFLSPSKLRQKASSAKAKESSPFRQKTSLELLKEASKPLLQPADFDVFLSYASLDWDIVYALYLELKEKNLTVYVDRVEDSHLDRSNVTKATADVLRRRMRSCKSLLFATTENLSNSKWLPWEVGYSDGHHGKVAILPITELDHFVGQEYLGLYSVMEEDGYVWSEGRSKVTHIQNWLLS